MTTAERWESKFPKKDDGSLIHQTSLNRWLTKVFISSTETSYPLGTGSHDPTVCYHFKDGSKLEIGNPGQSAFRAFCLAW